MGLRDRTMEGLARQLGRPQGVRGRLVAQVLNRANRRAVLAAVAASGLQPGQVCADVGFGGGVGLAAALDRVGPGGVVHGVELSDTALAMAARRWRSDIGAGRLALHPGSLTDLPLPDGSLDAAFTVNTIYFVAEVERAFAELRRVVRPGGRAVVGIGDPDDMRGRPFTAHGFTLREAADVMSLLRAAGFAEVVDQRVGSDRGAFHVLVAS